MNRRQKKKIQKQIMLRALEIAVEDLDETLFPEDRKQPKYKTYVKRLPYRDAVVVYRTRDNNLKIEVREKEGNHGRPHFHAKVKDQTISIAIDNFEILAGDLDTKKLKTVLAWARENSVLLKKTWESFHGSIVQVA